MNEDSVTDTLITEEINGILKKDNLNVNDDKNRENNPICLEREKDKNKENWRMVEKLGSLLGDTEDVIRRKQLASAAMTKINKEWIRGRKIHIKKRLKMYNTLVKPILTYNSCKLGLTKNERESMNAFHRQQLRLAWELNWKMKVRNTSCMKYVTVDQLVRT